MKRNRIFLAISMLVGSVSIVQAVDYPTANPDSYSTTAGQSISFMPMNNDVGNAMYITKVDSPSPWGTGSNTHTGSEITYTPPAGFTGETTFWYQIKDNQGLLTSAPITVTVSAEAAPSAWPTAGADTASTTYGQAITIDPLTNDTGAGLTIDSVNTTTTAGSRAEIVDNKILYTPSEWAVNGDSFWYVMKDNQGRKNAAKITVTVTEATTKGAYPTAGSDTYSVTQDSSNNTLNILANDTGDSLSIKQLYDWTAMGGRTSQVNGVVSYSPAAGFTGTDNFWYVIVDAYGRTNAAKATIEVGESKAETPNGTDVGGVYDITGAIFTQRSSDCADYTNTYSATPKDVQLDIDFVADVVITSDDTSCTFTSNSVPNHDFNEGGAFGGGGGTITATDAEFTVTRTPALAAEPTALTQQTKNAIFLNGVKLDIMTAGCYKPNDASAAPDGNVSIGCQTDSAWLLDALGTESKFGADANNGHTQPGGIYHYHGSPNAMFDDNPSGEGSPVIGFAADGFPVYGSYFKDPSAGDVRKAISGYTLKTESRGERTDTNPGGTPTGEYNDDWEFTNAGDLDECNGMTVNGQYGYYVTDSYPWVMKCFSGTPDPSFGGGDTGGGAGGPPPQ